MDEILKILCNDARVSAEEIAKLTGKGTDTVKRTIKKYEKNGTIVKYKTVIDHDLVKDQRDFVRALIEVSVAPQKKCRI